MEKKLAAVTVDGEIREYPVGITYLDIAEDYQPGVPYDIVLALVGNKLQELNKKLKRDCTIKFLTTADDPGHKAYERSATLMLLKAIYDVAGLENIRRVRVDFSISKGLYCDLDGDITLDEAFLCSIKKRMLQMVEDSMPIKKKSMHTDDAIGLFKKYGMLDKEKLFHYRRVSRVNIYSMNEFEDYYYGYMLPHAGYLKYFDLFLYDTGLVLQLPEAKNPVKVPVFEPQIKLFQVMKEAADWGDMLEIDTVGALNDKITRGDINELILVQEALQEKKIASLAETVSCQPDKKFVMIAGPSSSGKTTFSHRLSVQLLAHGLKPHPIAADNYFVDREFTPRDEFGKHNFECLEALDVKQFNEDMCALLAGERVELPSFNFKTGKREYKGNFKQLGRDDILVLEGIHCLNDKLSFSLPRESKFKIYISALTQLNVDEHNRIPTTDGRLVRRMIRDARTRGTSAKDTIAMWSSVRRGEEKNIFPYQEEADAMFNSALIYELAVLKQYAEPILFGISKEEPEFMEAKRLLKFFDYFVAVGSENVPHNSILREFIGGSCFHV